MNNQFDEMRQTVNNAKSTLSAADDVAHSMAQLLRGRLHHVGEFTLKDLKKELRDFNAHTGEWKK